MKISTKLENLKSSIVVVLEAKFACQLWSVVKFLSKIFLKRFDDNHLYWFLKNHSECKEVDSKIRFVYDHV